MAKNEGIQWKLIESQAILLNINGSILLRLDAVATKIWLAINGIRSGRDIAEYLSGEFEVEKNRAEKDVGRLLKQLMQDGAIKWIN